MLLSRWTKDGETAEVVESPPRTWVAWNVDRGMFAVESAAGRAWFDSLKELEDALFEGGWVKE